jgi:hypothetical protein
MTFCTGRSFTVQPSSWNRGWLVKLRLVCITNAFFHAPCSEPDRVLLLWDEDPNANLESTPVLSSSC